MDSVWDGNYVFDTDFEMVNEILFQKMMYSIVRRFSYFCTAKTLYHCVAVSSYVASIREQTSWIQTQTKNN